MNKPLKTLQNYVPIWLIVSSLMLTGISHLLFTLDPIKFQPSDWSEYLCWLPVACTLVAWPFAGARVLNSSAAIFWGIAAHLLGAILLFLGLPINIEWYHPVMGFSFLMIVSTM